MIKTSNRATVRQPAHSILIEHIQEMIKASPNASLSARLGIHYSTVIMSAVFFESAIFSLLEQLCKGTAFIDSEVLQRISERLTRDCARATSLDGYGDLYHTLTGQKLPEAVGLKSWEALKILFNLRNHLVHGRSLILDIRWEDDLPINAEHQTTLEVVEGYFVKTGLFTNIPVHQRHFHEYLDHTIANWAWDTSSSSVLAIAETRKGASRTFFSFLNQIEGFRYEIPH